jgi:hypothetical protein
MKKFIPKLLLLSGVAIAVAACSKKDSAAPGGDIVGKWSVVSDTTRTYDNKGTLVDTEVDGDILPTDYVQFNQNGTGSEEEQGFKATFTYTLNGTTLHFLKASANIGGVIIPGTAEDVTIKHLDAHTLYTIQVTPDTVNNTIYQTKESTHFTK